MAKINITKPTNEMEALALLSAFKADSNTYIIFDSERIGSMGLPIIYISKYTDKLEKITDADEWQNVKNYLKGIINGTAFEYVLVDENLLSDEVYYTPLTLPTTSFDVIKNRYVVDESSNNPVLEPINEVPEAPIMPDNNVASNIDVTSTPVSIVAEGAPNIVPEAVPAAPAVMPSIEAIPSPALEPINEIPEAPIMPNNNVVSNTDVASTPVSPIVEEVPNIVPPFVPVAPEVAPSTEVTAQISSVEPVAEPTLAVEPALAVDEKPIEKETTVNFDMDKETFLKACENMFDALVSKYQKELIDIERRERELTIKEQEINNKMASASEALANAEAKEQVANIAHDNAQKIMDLSSIMPHPTDTQAGVI